MGPALKMARSRRGGGMGARRAPAAAPRRAPPSRPASTSARTPAPAPPTSTPAPMQAAKLSGGGDSSSGQQQAAVPEASQQPMTAASAVDSNEACGSDKQMFFDCLKTNNEDAQSCSFLFEQLQQCQNSSTQISFQ